MLTSPSEPLRVAQVIQYYKEKVVEIKADKAPDDVAAQIAKAL